MSKTNIPKKVIELCKELEMNKEETLWDCHGTWVMYHKALEKIAVHKGVTFDEPKVIHSDVAQKSVVMLVTGRMDQRTEWSFGEATPANNKNAYPFAMSEKRAKDRVILKLVGLHGDVYSDTEIDRQAQDDIKERATKVKKDPPKDDPPKDDPPKDPNKEEAETDPNKIAEWEKIAFGYMKNIDQLPNQGVCLAWFERNKTVLKNLKIAVPRLYHEVEAHYTNKQNEIKNKN